MNCLPKIMLDDAVAAFRLLSHQTNGPWLVRLADGRCLEAVFLLAPVPNAARAELGGRDCRNRLPLTVWDETLAALASAPGSLAGRVDWITKRGLLQQFCNQEKISWNDPWLKSQDLEYHQIEPGRSLGLALARTPAPWQISPQEAAAAILQAPTNTRAAVRSRVMHLLQDEPCSYYLDWEIVGVEGGHALHLLNPFDPNPKEADKWMQILSQPGSRRSR